MTAHDPDTRDRVYERQPPRKRERAKASRHSFPGVHLSSVTRACMCTQSCCQTANGCCCSICSGAGHSNCKRATLTARGELRVA